MSDGSSVLHHRTCAIFVINAVYHRCFQQNICFNFHRTQSCGSICGEERASGTAAENYNSALFRCEIARLRIYGSAICCMLIAVCTRTSNPSDSSISATANAFIVVASIPMWSALVRSIFSLERPRQKLPPPTTIPICTPAFTHF